MLEDGALGAAQMRAERHVLQHAHVGQHIDVLEGAADAAARDDLRGPAGDALALEVDLARRSATARR